ncbi:fructose-1,6-bisphosphatase, class II [Bellilinea caldifistulae]|uniref:Fructose-1,6-bisphosphatase n=1 Tax=Bellilinea caldifistulae TaxID=360411 RepID=A0A0P6X7U7_9CHLR|nr:class II fructose-bisphosphatase [Bellilinea caldifistulae]KPL76401.1 fructose 1,6-bisphosphatase [Bellilinea caldifistulae]GAP12099.1 fructose-1,6-bisphosphatase, class II [Bellilinea caldifistulae]
MIDSKPTRNLALELVRVTEAAALAAGRYVGRGDKIAADRAAVDAMRLVLNTIQMDGVIVIGEGEKDEAPMLYNGERLGTGEPPQVDIAVDPIDGTRPTAFGLPNAIATVALAPRGTMFNPGPIVYMDKIAVGPEARDVIDIEAPVEDNLRKIARAKGGNVEDLTCVILDRPRHEELIKRVRRVGARIILIPDGDVAGALMASLPETGIDVLLGIGGTPEGVLAACALRCTGGMIQGKLHPRNEEERRKGEELGYDFNRVLTIDDLVSSEDVFFAATGITNGELLKGVDYYPGGATTDSIVLRGLTGTSRRIISTHRLTKLSKISAIHY